MNVKRIGIFFDGNFLLHSSNYYNYVHSIHKRLCVDGIIKFAHSNISQTLCLEISKVACCQYFRGRLNAADAASRNNQLYNDRVFDDILMSEGVQTFYLPLRNSCGKREESGTNVWLSLNAVEMAIKKEVDIVVLIVGDSDYLPLVRKLKQCDVITVVMGWDFEYINDEGVKMSTKTSLELKNNADIYIPMNNVIEDGLKSNDNAVENMFVK